MGSKNMATSQKSSKKHNNNESKDLKNKKMEEENFVTLLMKIPSTLGTKNSKTQQPKQQPENQRNSSQSSKPFNNNNNNSNDNIGDSAWQNSMSSDPRAMTAWSNQASLQSDSPSKPFNNNNINKNADSMWKNNMASASKAMNNKMATWNNQASKSLNNNNNIADPMWKNNMASASNAMTNKMTIWNNQAMMPSEEIQSSDSWNAKDEEMNQWASESSTQFNGDWNSQDISGESASNRAWNDNNQDTDLNNSQWKSDSSYQDMTLPGQIENGTSPLDMEQELKVNLYTLVFKYSILES